MEANTDGRRVNGVHNQYANILVFFSGNDNVYAITARKKYTLRIDLADFEGRARFAEYENFAVASEDNNYRLTLGSYSGNAGDYDAYFVIILLLF